MGVGGVRRTDKVERLLAKVGDEKYGGRGRVKETREKGIGDGLHTWIIRIVRSHVDITAGRGAKRKVEGS